MRKVYHNQINNDHLGMPPMTATLPTACTVDAPQRVRYTCRLGPLALG